MAIIQALTTRWVWVGLVAVVVGAGGAWTAYSTGYEAGATRVQTAWDAERLEALRARAEFETAARKREQELAARAAQQRQELRREINRIEQRHAAVVDGLRDRPDRPAVDGGAVPGAATAGVEPATGCTGAELYRPDGEFLAREAARADRLRLALATCIAAYGAVSGPPADAR